MLTGTRVWKRITAEGPGWAAECSPQGVLWFSTLVFFVSQVPCSSFHVTLFGMAQWRECCCFKTYADTGVLCLLFMKMIFCSCTVHERFVTNVIRNFTSLIPAIPLAAGEVAGTQGMQSHGLLLWPWHHSVGKASCRRKEWILSYETGRLKSWGSALTGCYWGEKRRTCTLCAGNSSMQRASRWDWVKRRQENEPSAAKTG